MKGWCENSVLDRDRGAILILLAILCLGLLLMIGLAIDTSTLRTAKKEQLVMGDSVASVAMSTFAVSPHSQRVDKLEDARSKAQDVAQVDIDASFTRGFLKDGNTSQDLGPKQSGPVDGATGNIVPGKWHFVPTWLAPDFDPATGACVGARPCPCDSNGKWAGPCFQPLNLDDPTQDSIPVNAFRADLHLRQDAPLRTSFMRVGGHEYVNVDSSAVIATRPMRVVFLVDLSRRSHSETHLPYDVVGAGKVGVYSAAESAYRLNGSCSGVENYDTSLAPATCPALAGTCTGNPSLRNTACNISGGWWQFPGLDAELYNYRCTSGGATSPIALPLNFRVATSHGPLVRVVGEYRCFSLNYTEGGVAAPAASYMVDIYRGPVKNVGGSGTIPFTGPEPLNDMLYAVNQGLDRLKKRHVNDDYAAIIGFDQRADMDLRTLPLTSPTDPNFVELQALTADPGDPVKRNRDHFFFPREEAGASFPAALHQATQMLMAQSDFPAADNHIVLITNGFSNCYTDVNGNHTCGHWEDDAANRQSIDEATQFVIDELAPKHVQFHVLMFNEMTHPHEVKRRGTLSTNSNRCMQSSEATEQGQPFVNYSNSSTPSNAAFSASVDSTTGNITFNNFFTYSNKLAEAVVATQGVWGPMRKACMPTAAELTNASGTPDATVTCGGGGLNNFLDSQCGQQPSGGALPAINGAGSTNPPPITDADGRLVCDSLCRTRKDQIKDYVNQIFDRNPYAKVDDGVKVN